MPYLTTENLVLDSPTILFAAINNLSEANFVAPYKLMGFAALSVESAITFSTLFLIAAEAIASTDGLGYRIFLVRRYLSMDLILPYVAWITLLAFIIDWLLIKLNQKLFPWFEAVGKS